MQYNMNILLDPIVNFGKAIVSTGYNNVDTTITLTAGGGAKLPDPSIDGSFNLVWFNNTDYADPADDPNVEIVRCISIVTDTLVLMRGQEGTSASNKNIPGKIYKVILSQTKKSIGDIQTDAQSRVDTHSALSTGVHGVGLDTVDGITARNTAISTHAALIIDIHGISAGLDAIKPVLPVLGQRYIAVDTNKDYECYVPGTWRDVTATHAALTVSVHGFDASGNAPPQTHGLASHTGVIGDHQGNLTGIGTNTHAMIDSHIGATANVHNFDASGNAPAQTHGKTKHDSTTVDGGAALSLATQIPLHDSARHTGTIGAWAQVDKTTSSIADITTRSHGSLTDGVIPGTTNNHAAIDTAVTNSTSHIAATTGIHGTSGNLVATGASVSGQYNSAKYTTTTTLNWNNGNVQYIVLGNGANGTFSFANPRDGGRYMIILKQPGSGTAGTVTWPGSVVWPGAAAPILTTTNGKVDIITFVYDGTNTLYYGGSALNY